MERKLRSRARLGYFFGLPALYTVLTVSRSNRPLRQPAEEALKMWGLVFLIFFGQRFLVDLLWSIYYVPALANLDLFVGLGLGAYVCYRGTRPGV